MKSNEDNLGRLGNLFQVCCAARTMLRSAFIVNQHLLIYKINKMSNQLKDFKHVLKRFLKFFFLYYYYGYYFRDWLVGWQILE